MPRHARSIIFLLCSASLICISAGPLHAEPITVTITSGAVSFSPNTGTGKPFELYGTDGFSFDAHPYNGLTRPSCCVAPGTPTSYLAGWSSSDLAGTIAYNGDVFTNVGSVASVNQASLRFASSPFTLPPPDESTSITITAPFTLTGSFVGSPGSGIPPGKPAVSLTLVGSGIGTVLFTWHPAGPLSGWDPILASLQVGANEAVPEPSSIVLVCLSLVGVFSASRYRCNTAR